MGFFGKIFASKEAVPAKIETTIDLLPTLIEKDFSSKIQELEMSTAKNLAELKFTYGKITELIKQISEKELEKKENERFNKAASTSKKQLEKQLTRLMEKISPEKVGNDLSDMRKYVGESYALLLNDVNTFRKSIAYTSVYLKEDMKQLGSSLQEFLNKLKSVQDKMNSNKELFEFENAKKKIQDLITQKKELKEIATKKEDITKKISNSETELQKAQQKNEDLKSGDEVKVLNNLEVEKKKLLDEKQQLKVEISSMLSTIDRPLQRFRALVDSGRWVMRKDEKDLLIAFITNPVLALKKDVNGKRFKEILKEIIKAIEEGKIELKDREKEKRLGALRELINFNFFEKIFWRLNEIQRKLIETEHKIKESIGQKMLLAEEEKEHGIAKEIEALKEEIDDLNKKQADLNRRIEKEETIVLNFGEKVLNKKIILKAKK
jgi:hypothetical protein